MRHLVVFIAVLMASAGMVITGCASSPQAPAAPATTAAPTKATVSQPTAAPTKATVSQPTAAPAKKADFPTNGRPITIIVPYPAGSGTDIAARLLSQPMEKDLGVPVEVVNKAGAGSQIGLTELVSAKPDGHTLGIVQFAATLITYMDPDRKAVYNRKSFQPLALFQSDDMTISVRADSPYKSVKELLDAAKAKPDTIKYGCTAMGNPQMLGLLLEQQVPGSRFSFVQFDGSANALTAMLGGHIDSIGYGIAGPMPQHMSGQIRVIGTGGKEQSRFLPDVKTFIAQGINFSMVSTSGIAGPAGIPKEVVDTLDRAIKKAVTAPEFKQKMNEMGMEADHMGPAAFEDYWADYEKLVNPLIELAKARSK